MRSEDARRFRSIRPGFGHGGGGDRPGAAFQGIRYAMPSFSSAIFGKLSLAENSVPSETESEARVPELFSFYGRKLAEEVAQENGLER